MVNPHDPTEIARDSSILKKILHVVDGIYLWEFAMNLTYEWSIIRRRRPYQPTIWVYLTARLSCLSAVILNLIVMNVTGPINCQVWAVLSWTFISLALVLGSLLIVLRIMAVWDRSKTVTATAFGVWGINIAFMIQGLSRIRAVWAPEDKTCVFLDYKSNQLSMVVLFIANVILLVILLIGLFRLLRSGDMFNLWRVLWKQGAFCLSMATVAELPPAVLVSLDLNDVVNSLCPIPSVILRTMATTRMYRSLSDFINFRDIAQELESLSQHRCSVEEPQMVTDVRIHPGRMGSEVTVHNAYGEYPTRMSRASGNDSCPSLAMQLPDVSHNLNTDYGVEVRKEK